MIRFETSSPRFEPASQPLNRSSTTALEPMKLDRAVAPQALEKLERAFVLQDGIEIGPRGRAGGLGGGLGGGGLGGGIGGPALPERPRSFEEQRRFEAEQRPHFIKAERLYDPKLDSKLEALESFIEQRRQRYLDAYTNTTDPKMQAYYRDLYVAMVTDKADLDGWRGMTNPVDKADLYNRLIREVDIEIKHNVVVARADGKQWTDADLENLDKGLSAAGPRTTLEGDLSMMVKAKDVVDSSGHRTDAKYDGGVISFSDLHTGDAKTSTVRSSTLFHLGMGKVPWGPHMDRLMADSGWQRVGDQGVPSLAKFNHGDVATAKELRARGVAIADGVGDDAIFRISKRNGDAFIVPTSFDPASPGKLVSRRAEEGPAEDFAESYRMFVEEPEKLRAASPAKFALMWELRQAGYL